MASFFAAENTRDWNAYAAFLHPQVEWTLNDGSHERKILGKEQYLHEIKSAYANSTTTFHCIETMSDRGRRLIATMLVNDDGERSLDVFVIEDGLIRREWEFLLGRA
ncbi:nuclear transport factor 2 family protein [Actinomyces ruminis]|uniref:Nuclear transport factor 2 family protein n=1 Tax=Actinomyces ruminis TaxID=1937003 RepID=A0ABX4MDQ1_9ACTO|nr:nuclear transport factor 2 family protein [Actinomyces ruminis]PHP53605.1 nuclear transport factor 2 family protein [Actinomyces ruminis]